MISPFKAWFLKIVNRRVQFLEFFDKAQRTRSRFLHHFLREAAAKGEKLRFMATLENGKAKSWFKLTSNCASIQQS